MKQWPVLMALCFLLLHPLSARSETWQDLVRLAGEGNAGIQSRRQLANEAESLYKAQYSEFLPKVSAFGRQGHVLEETELGTADDQGREYGVQMDLELFNGFGSVNRLKAGESRWTLSKWQARLYAVDLRLKLRSHYFELLINDKKQNLTQKILNRFKTNSQFIRLKYKSGAEARWAVDLAEAQLAKSQTQLENLKTERDSLLRQLQALIGAPLPTTFAVQEEAESLMPPAEKVTFELKRHPAWQVAKTRIETARYNQKSIVSEYVPDVSLAYSMQRTKLRSADEYEESFYGLSLTWNVFDGLQRFRRLQAANAQISARESLLEEQKRQLLARVDELRNLYRIKRAQLQPAKMILTAARERVEVVSKQYRQGLKSYLDWERAHRELLEAEEEEISVMAEALGALARLEHATGKDLQGDI